MELPPADDGAQPPHYLKYSASTHSSQTFKAATSDISLSNFLLSLPTLTNQDRELFNVAVLPTCSRGDVERREGAAYCRTDRK